VKIDPSGHLLNSFIDLNNFMLSRFSLEERRRIGVHTCPESDLDSTHSGCRLCRVAAQLVWVEGERFLRRACGRSGPPPGPENHMQITKPDQRIFIGVIAPVDPHIVTPEEVRDPSFEPGKNWRLCQGDG
jgi:5-methyltetrahydropteroyltriglutamate--homocysteine methyltransferase